MRGNGTRPHRDLELAAAGGPNRSTATKPGSDGGGSPVSFASELRLAVAALGVVRDVPQVLVYSICVPLLCLGSLGAPYVFVWTVFGGGTLWLALAFPMAMLLCCLVFCVLQVAMCYEVNEAFEGRRPVPLSGIRVALGRPQRIVLAATLAFVVVNVQRGLPAFGRVGQVLGAAGARGYEVASLFAFPLIATTDESVARSLESVLASVEEQWDRGLAVSVGTKAVGMALTWGGIVLAILLLGAAVFGYGPSFPPYGPFTLPLAAGVGGLVLGFSIQILVRTVLKTALFRYVRDGEFPVGTDAERVIEPPGDVPSGSPDAGGSGP